MMQSFPVLVLLVLAAARPPALTGPEIIDAFDGQTIHGTYADGFAFRETYMHGGRLAYWDPRGSFRGDWSVTNGLFCTFYDDDGGMGAIVGGCFRIEKISSNCYDFYAAAGSTEEALKPIERPRYTARAFISGSASTCPEELQS